MNRRILITGASGIVGSALTHRLENAGFSTTGVSLSSGMDVRDFSTLENISTPHDALVHCAAAFNGDCSDISCEPGKTNIAGTANAVRLAQNTGCRHFVLISTISTIEHPKNDYFNTPYIQSKLRAEQVARNLCADAEIPLAILRLPQIYDVAGRSRRHQPFLFNLINSALTGDTVRVSNAKTPKRNFLLDTDAAELIARTIEQHITGEFDVAHPLSHTFNEICDMIRDAAGTPPVIIIDTSAPPPPEMYIPPDTPLFALTGFTPGTSLRKGIELIVGVETIKLKETNG